MAQVTETVARGILAGHGYTDNEVRQLAHHWLATHGEAPASKIEGLTAAQESLGVEFERVLHDNLFDLYEESPQTASHGQAPAGATEEVENLRKALVYAAFALHDTPQYMLAQGITLIDGDTVRVSRDGWTVEASVNPHRQPAPAPATQPIDPISELNLQIVD